MFTLIRHATYQISNGQLTEDGANAMRRLAVALETYANTWQEIRYSPTQRTKFSAEILHTHLHLPLHEDARINTDGNAAVYAPPHHPQGYILVTHLPVITRLMRAWSHEFHLDEPPLTDLACGYIIIHEQQKIIPISSL